MRRRLDPEERRDELLAFGREHFAVMSFDQMSVEDIAAEAGVSKGTIYKYFGGRRGFYVATIEDVIAKLLEVISQVAALESGDRPRRLVEAFVDYAIAHEGIYLALVRGGLGADGEVRLLLDQVRDTACELVFDVFGVSEPAPRLRLSVVGWVASVEFTTAHWLRNRTVGRDDVVALLLDGLNCMVKGNE